MLSRRQNSIVIVAAVVITASAVAMPSVRQSLLRTAGWALVVDDPLTAADFIVLSINSGGAGALEATDLVQSGIATRVAVFTDPPSGDDHEFIRRGLPYDDASARQIRQLGWLGVKDVVEITRSDNGTTGEGEALARWARQNEIRSIVFVTSRDHSRRMRRVLKRALSDQSTRIAIRSAKFSGFDPDRWWVSRGGVRTEILELQKLVLDVVMHPVPF